MTAENDAQPDRTEAFMARAMADWGDAVYRLALSQTRSKADAEDVYQDVYQDVFMRLYGDATEFTSSEHLKAWLLRVTINRCRDLAKSNWNRHTVAFDPVRDDIAELVRDPRDADVWDAVGQLPDNLRSSVHLHYVEGYTTDEIAIVVKQYGEAARHCAHLAVPRPRAGERPVDARKRADGSACRASVRRTRPSHAPRPAKGGAP